MIRRGALILAFTVLPLIILLATASRARCEEVSGTAASPSSFDPAAAARAYLDKVPADKKERSDAYFEGGYWLQLWNYLLGAGIALLLLAAGLSRRMRDFTQRIAPWKPVQTWIYWLQYLLLTTVLSFPLTAYDGFFREHKYGLATQSFVSWLGDQAKEILVGVLLGGLLMMILYGVLRRTSRTWWIWGSVTVVVFLAFTIMIGPVYIDPLFNTYTKLQDPKVKEPILRMARANGIEAEDVYVMDASRQTTRVSANVSGLFGTMRITLNDNLLNRCSLPEIQAVMGHEMGHYVLNHITKSLLFLGVVTVIGFAIVRALFDRIVMEKGEQWGIGGVGDLAGLPLILLLFSTYLFVLTPVINHYIHTGEVEADIFGLNAARQPDGFAETALKLGEYRKLEPGPIEELIFFDHPSGRNRIEMAMRWKAENIDQDRPQD